jgi:hypothetical protein
MLEIEEMIEYLVNQPVDRIAIPLAPHGNR